MPRGTFSSHYAAKKQPGRDTVRLLDLMKFHTFNGNQFFKEPPEVNEFCVVDVQNKEKAFFAIPGGMEHAQIERMIASHFDASPTEIFERVWLA